MTESPVFRHLLIVLMLALTPLAASADVLSSVNKVRAQGCPGRHGTGGPLRESSKLDAVAKQDEVAVAPDDLEKLARAYAQAGQPLPRSQEQLRALTTSLLREKTITHLVDLTAGPDPDAENDDEVEAAVESAEAAALAGLFLWLAARLFSSEKIIFGR